MNNAFDFQKTYFLKAQSPMIHFQYNATGACLRATEVKPKLDRFLIRKFRQQKIDFSAWRCSEDHEALDYKMTLKAGTDHRGSLTVSNFPMYFGNMGNNDPKDIVFRDCYLTIICFKQELRDLIDKYIGEFFLLHNFGTRQTKGFGGFILDEFDTETSVEKYSEMNQLFFYADTETDNIRDLMNHASTLYAIFKGGLNRSNNGNNPERYIKAYIQRQYLDEKYPAKLRETKTGSEKAFVKSYILKNDFPDPDNKYNYNQYLFIRALLGLADQFNFLKADNGIPLHKTVYVYNADKDCIVDRFPSPITIKIIGTRVFFLFDVDAVQPILNRLFYFTTDNVAKRIKEYTAEERYSFFAKKYPDNRIQTPKSFTKEDAYKIMSGFVKFFNQRNNDYPSAKEKLDNFGPPFKNSSTLTLEMGGKTPNA